MIGRSISHYRIVSQLGSGGMGVVYAAEDVRLGRSVALKFVPEDLAKDHQAVSRLRAEARAASALNHPNICTIHDIGEFEGRPFIVMELITGQTLRERLAAGGLKIHDVVDIGIQVADALDATHSRGILHRDIKPANLFVTERRQVKILDFGLAKLLPQQASTETTAHTPTDPLTGAGVTIGTVSYMSPEQVTGDQLDGRTDLFSLGIVLYECVTNNRPFVGKTPAVIFSAILNRSPVAPIVYNPEVPLRLQEVILNCLEKDPELRYQDAAGLRADLKRIKRDLESGLTGVADVTATAVRASASARPGPGSSGTSLTPKDSAGAPASAQVGSAPRRTARTAAIAAAIALAAVSSALIWSRARSPHSSSPAPVSDATVRSRLDSAAASMEARNYRAALADADEVVRLVPDHREAIRIRETARGMIARFDEAIATASRYLAAGDANGATGALAVARTIDPAAPAIVDLAAQISQLNDRLEKSRRASEPSSSVPVQRRPQPSQPSSRSTAGPIAPPALPMPAPPQVSSQPASPATSPPPATTPPAVNPPADIQLPRQPSAAPSPKAVPTDPPPRSETPPPAEPASTGRAREASPSPSPQPEEPGDDEASIRRVVATYARAIETKDLALFRSVKPNLSSEEQRRIDEGFRNVSSQRVSVTILGIERRGQDAFVRLRRRDQIEAGGRMQTAESQQTLTLTRAGSGWVIREIGR